MNVVRLGIIGAGRIGQLHLDNVVRHIPEATVVALADIAIDHARTVAAERKVPNVYSDPTEILESPDVDAVLICSSTDTHARFIKAAAKAGKHAFCEKPIALDLPTIDGAVSAAEKAGIALQIGFNRRFDPNFLEARRQVSDGAVGDVHLLRITSRDPGPPPIEYVKVSGGLFLDMTIHDFDMARYMVGDEVEEVYAVGGVLVDPMIGEVGDIDTAVVTLQFRNGAIGVIDNSREAVYGYDQRVEVFGSAGMVSVVNPKPHTAVHSGREGDSAPPLLHFFLERYAQSFVAELRAFVEAASGRGEVPVTGADGRAPVVMALAAQQSLREGRPVRLSEIDG